MAQKNVYELVAASYPCLVLGDNPYQSKVFAEKDNSGIEFINVEGGALNSKGPANMDTS